jgi:hypothetical protein
VEDVEVSGEADWDYNFPGLVKVRVEVRSGRENGELQMTWNYRESGSQAQITGKRKTEPSCDQCTLRFDRYV